MAGLFRVLFFFFITPRFHVIGEPKYKYGQQEQVTVRNHNSLRTVGITILGGGGRGGGL